MLSKLDQLAERLEELNSLLAQENATADMDSYRKMTREHAELGPLVTLYSAYTQAAGDIGTAQELLSDPDIEGICARRNQCRQSADGSTGRRSAKDAAAQGSQ